MRRYTEFISVLARRAQINNMLNNLNFKVMIKTYYRSEYDQKQWVKLIDEALRLRCKISYSIYGNTCVIDSTETETRLLAFTNNTNDSNHRRKWAEHLHERIRKAAM